MTQNLLSQETSPYLLQHKDNPVHWQPWGEAAFARARAADKPILLSIGYAACHWCHVMAHESFESPAIAQLMNDHFINVKVDREERPDVDRIYMSALHALGEPGGWPLTMFLTPDAAPFWGGTYFPPEPRYGRPGFPQILTQISHIWKNERHKVTSNTEALKQALEHQPRAANSTEISPGKLHDAARIVLTGFDPVHGGLKGAPKFPNAPILNFVWQSYLHAPDPQARAALDLTLSKICQGGIYDHLAGGFARYTVDARWLVPHFEKMLYDNAQLVSLLTNLSVTSGNQLFRIRIEETIAFVLQSMTTEGEAFASSYDADSEGEEGKYYVWSSEEIAAALGTEASLFREIYDVSPEGNWEGHNILNRLHHPDLFEAATEARLQVARVKLCELRDRRIPPGFDDKVLADWNGLMIAALAEAALAFHRDDWLNAAQSSFKRVLELLADGNTLHHAYRNGQRRGVTTADGYANLIAAALALYGATGESQHLKQAEQLTRNILSSYWDEERGGFFFTSSHTTDLIVRSKFANDDATPNANGIMLRNLAHLHALTGNASYATHAEAILKSFGSLALGNPFACPGILSGALALIDPIEVVLVAAPNNETGVALLSELIRHTGVSPLIHHIADTGDLPESHPAYHKAKTGAPTLYLCRGQVCASPATTPQGVHEAARLLGLASP